MPDLRNAIQKRAAAVAGTTDSGREYRKQKANAYFKEQGFTHARTKAPGKYGEVTIHKVECPIIQRLMGAMNSSVSGISSPEIFKTSRQCPTCGGVDA